MEKIREYQRKLGLVKWFALPLAVTMYCATNQAFGDVISGALGAVFGVAFVLMVKHERHRAVCEYVALDLISCFKGNGYEDARVDITMTRLGLIVRVIMVAAGEARVKAINRLTMNRISRADYRETVLLSQVVDVENEKFIKKAIRELDDEVIRELRELTGAEVREENAKSDRKRRENVKREDIVKPEDLQNEASEPEKKQETEGFKNNPEESVQEAKQETPEKTDAVQDEKQNQ